MPINSFEHYPMSWRPQREQLQRPYYQSLASLLEDEIKSGRLTAGTKLPPQRELADFLDLNFTTVTRAYKVCELKGLIYAVTGSGTFVAPNATRTVTISAHEAPPAIDLAFVASFEQTNELVAKTIKRVAAKSYVEQLLNYNDPLGLPQHRQFALEWLQMLKVNATLDGIAIVAGALNAMAIVLVSLFAPGQRIATDWYTYANFIELAKMLHIQLVPIAADEQGMKPSELEKQCQQVAMHGIFLMPSCANPTAIAMPFERKQQLAAIIRKHRLTLIEDDIHAFLSVDVLPDYGEPLYNLVPERSVYICSMSKSLCSGVRIAYIAFRDSERAQLLRGIFNINVKTSALDGEVIAELIRSGKARDIVAQKAALATAANRCYDRYFPKRNEGEHPLSFYRWLPLTTMERGEQLERRLEQRNVRVFHSDRFLSGASGKQHYLRIALSSTSDLAELEEGLQIVAEQLSE